MPNDPYAHRSLTDKLGIKPGAAVAFVGAKPTNVTDLVCAANGRDLLDQEALAAGARADVILYWPHTADEITAVLATLRNQIAPDGGIWVITAKRGKHSASGMAYLSQEALISLGLAANLVDNKVCAFSADESAMRFVIRKRER